MNDEGPRKRPLAFQRTARRWALGTGDGADPFYESYRFLDDSTILRVTYADSTARAVSDGGVLMELVSR